MKDELHQAAKGTPDDTLSFLELEPVFGHLIHDDRFTTVYAEMVQALYENPDISRLMRKLL